MFSPLLTRVAILLAKGAIRDVQTVDKLLDISSAHYTQHRRRATFDSGARLLVCAGRDDTQPETRAHNPRWPSHSSAPFVLFSHP